MPFSIILFFSRKIPLAELFAGSSRGSEFWLIFKFYRLKEVAELTKKIKRFINVEREQLFSKTNSSETNTAYIGSFIASFSGSFPYIKDELDKSHLNTK